jgi:hypothetical protein
MPSVNGRYNNKALPRHIWSTPHPHIPSFKFRLLLHSYLRLEEPKNLLPSELKKIFIHFVFRPWVLHIPALSSPLLFILTVFVEKSDLQITNLHLLQIISCKKNKKKLISYRNMWKFHAVVSFTQSRFNVCDFYSGDRPPRHLFFPYAP